MMRRCLPLALRLRGAHVVLAAALLGGCQAPTPVPADFGLAATRTGAASLEVTVAGAGRRLLATSQDVTRLVVTVTDGSGARYSRDALSNAVRFTDLAPGPAQVAVKAYGADRRLLGEQAAVARLDAGQTGTLAIDLALEAAPPATAPTTDLAVGVTLVDGPTLDAPPPAAEVPVFSAQVRTVATVDPLASLFVDGAGTARAGWNRIFPNGDQSYGHQARPDIMAEDRASGTVWSVSGSQVIALSPRDEKLTSFASPTTVVPHGLGVDGEGNLWLAGAQTLYKVSPTGQALGQWPQGAAIGGVAVDAAHGTVWVSLPDRAELVRLGLDGAALGTTAVNQNGDTLGGLALDAAGACWVTQRWTGSVAKVAPDGRLVGVFPAMPLADGVAIDPRGHAWVTGSSSILTTVTELSGDGAPVARWQLGYISSLAFDPDGALWAVSNDFGQATVIRVVL